VRAKEPGTLYYFAMRPSKGDDLIIIERYGSIFPDIFFAPSIRLNVI
jgi:hypothetical protein